MKTSHAPAACAICVVGDGDASRGGTNDTMRLCPTCRADPANSAWRNRPAREELDGAAVTRAAVGGRRLSEEIDIRRSQAAARRRRGRAPRPPNPRPQQVVTLLLDYTIREPRRPRGRHRALREWEWISRDLRLTEIAWLVGISVEAVRRILQRKRRALESPSVTGVAQGTP
jgi:hypothetical protein